MKQKMRTITALLPVLFLLSACTDQKETELIDAGLNTLLGMGMAFAVLILISLVIGLFPLINKTQAPRVKEKKSKEPSVVSENTETAQEREEIEQEQDEISAVIAAAIAAYESETGRDAGDGGYYVRSIRKRRNSSRSYR